MRLARELVLNVSLAVGSVGCALLLTRLLGLQVLGGVSPLFFAAVAVSAFVGGFRSGLIATALAGLCTAFFFQHPYSVPNLGLDDVIRLAAFLAVALMISSLQHANEVALARLKAAHDEVEQARSEAVAANLAKDRFLNVLGHELRNPLVPILSITSLRLQEFEAAGPRAAGSWSRSVQPDELRRDLETIRRNVEVEARLIDDLLDSRRIHAGKLRLLRQPEDVAAVLTQSVEHMRPTVESQGLVLNLRLVKPAGDPAHRPIVHGDATRLQQVFWNLLNNAAKFTRQGRICVSLRPARRGRHVAISFADTGIGIPREAAAHLFRPFAQVHDAGSLEPAQRRAASGGLGLGLSIVSALVAAHGGSVRVRSKPGRGSVFRMHLPASWQPRKETRTQAVPLKSATGGGRLRILIVDDHADTARITARLLSRAGHDVEYAEGVASALERAMRTKFDLLISDIGLSEGSGHDLMRQLQSRQHLRGIAVSGLGMPADIARSVAAGFTCHLVKPVPPEVLLEHVERMRHECGVA